MAGNNQDAASTPGSKQLKVDNWGTFFLHRLQMLYEKNENCDVTLQFHDGGEINVHRLVITTCTDYFQSLTVTPDNRLVLPPILKHNCVLPIVNFMYTGRLDFKIENHHNLLSTAKLLNMTILVKLLNAQVNNRENKVSQPSTPVSKNAEKKPITPPTPTNITPTLPGKKLPFWKKRTTPGHLPEEFYQSEAFCYESGGAATSSNKFALAHQVPKQRSITCFRRSNKILLIINSPCLGKRQSSRQVQVVSVEPAKPTRFEWPEEGDVKPSPVTLYSPSFDNISYDSELLVKPAKRSLPSDNQETAQEDSQDFQPQPAAGFVDNIKRFKSNSSQIENSFGLESDDDDDDDGHFESVHNNDDCGDEDDDDVIDNAQVVTKSGVGVGEPNKSFNDIIQTKVPPHGNTTIKKTIISPTVSTPKPILKPLTSDLTPTSHQSKKVRFSLSSEGKENANKKVEKQIVIQNKTVVSGNEKTKITANTISTNKSNGNNNSNHAKIIAEVLKKYPDLVKNNKNIRLKIMTPNNKTGVPKTSPTTPPLNKSASGKSKVSYVVVKSDLSNQNSSQEEVIVSTPTTGAENTTGPWFCHTCGTNSEPMNFETYYLYRRHLQDVHMERIDARICEHCGYKSSKRNLHLYHLYTKHNIQPPRNISFPKCDQCDYIALSDSLLIKHRNTHVGVSKDYICKVCNTAFKSHGALQGHMQTSLHNENPHKEYQCDFCDKVFSRNINLKAHIRTAHKDESRKLYDEEDPSPQQNLLQVIQVPVIDSLQNNLKGQQTLLLPAGMTILAESPSVPLLPSSESEALNNVASGIATSLNLNESNIMSDQTVIFLDSNSELLFDQSGNPVVMAETTVVTDGGSGEYIIPEMIATGNSISQVFTTQAQPVVTTAAGEVVPISVCTRTQTEHVQIHQQQPPSDMTVATPEIPSSDHTYADESVQQNGEIEEPSQPSNGRENSGISIFHVSDHSDTQPHEMENSDHIVPEGSESGRCIVGDNDHLISRPVETIQFAASNASNEMSSDSSTQPMEVCERGSIIIQPPSVIQHPALNVTVQSTCLQDVKNVTHSVTSNNGNVQCVNSNSVIVNGATPTLLVTSKPHPKDELVRDWDDFGDDEEVNADCSLVEIVGNEEADDVRPSRPTIELEESILPDM